MSAGRERGLIRNPYRPTPSAQPLVLAGRDEEIRFLFSRLHDSPEIPADIRMTGLRGIGKTALLKRWGEESEARGWALASIGIDPRFASEVDLASLLAQHANRKRETLSLLAAARGKVGRAAEVVVRSVKVGYGEWTAGIGVRLEEEAVDLGRVLTELVETALGAGKTGLLFCVDEAHLLRDDADADEFPLSLLLGTITELQVAGLPIALVLSGLPALNRNLGAARPQAERLFRGLELGPLDHDSSFEAFVGPLRGTGINANGDMVEQIVDEVEGYPHFIQVYGDELWTAAASRNARRLTMKLLRDTRATIKRRIEVDIYSFRMTQLAPADRDLLIAAARGAAEPLTLDSITALTPGTDRDSVESSVQTLVDLGILFDRADSGEFFYTVPGFEAFLRAQGERWSSQVPARTDS